MHFLTVTIKVTDVSLLLLHCSIRRFDAGETPEQRAGEGGRLLREARGRTWRENLAVWTLQKGRIQTCPRPFQCCYIFILLLSLLRVSFQRGLLGCYLPLGAWKSLLGETDTSEVAILCIAEYNGTLTV